MDHRRGIQARSEDLQRRANLGRFVCTCREVGEEAQPLSDFYSRSEGPIGP